MTNTIDEYWDVDGQSLHTHAWSIENVVRKVPPRRGSNILVPGRPGAQWVPKLADQDTMTLQMWVRGCDQDGVWASDPHGQMNDNIKFLKNLLWRSNHYFSITKRERRADGSFLVATGYGEYVGGMDNFSAIDQNREVRACKFTVDLQRNYPYFYGASISASTSGTVHNPGDDVARRITIGFSGAGSITNTTTGRTLSVGGACTVDVWQFSAPGRLATLTLSGQPLESYWFTLDVGDNTISSSGVSSLSFIPVYF